MVAVADVVEDNDDWTFDRLRREATSTINIVYRPFNSGDRMPLPEATARAYDHR